MVHEPTMGMHHDAVVLGAALKSIRPDIEVYSMDIPWNPNLDYEAEIFIPSRIRELAPYDAIFLFEHLYGNSPLRSVDFGRKRVFVPNVEWILPQDEVEIVKCKPDAIVYKNHFSKSMCDKIAGFGEVLVRAVTGWSSRDFSGEPHLTVEKDFKSFLHIKGMSDQKQTSLVLQAWLDNPDFPPLTIVASMHDNFLIPVALRAADNVEIIFRTLPEHALHAHQARCGVHIYPSYAEGFGHSLNEARVCRSVLITTDGPPMKDLVQHRETGFLVPVRKADVSDLRRSQSYEIRLDALIETIREVIATPVATLREIAAQSRNAYLADQGLFHQRIGEVFGPDGELPL